jgi:hypothetical protein
MTQRLHAIPSGSQPRRRDAALRRQPPSEDQPAQPPGCSIASSEPGLARAPVAALPSMPPFARPANLGAAADGVPGAARTTTLLNRPGGRTSHDRPGHARTRATSAGLPRSVSVERLRMDHERDVLSLALCVEHTPRRPPRPRASKTSPRVATCPSSSPHSGRLITASPTAASPSAPTPPWECKPAPSDRDCWATDTV